MLSILAIPVLYERVARKTFVAATGPGAAAGSGVFPPELTAPRTSVESR